MDLRAQIFANEFIIYGLICSITARFDSFGKLTSCTPARYLRIGTRILPLGLSSSGMTSNSGFPGVWTPAMLRSMKVIVGGALAIIAVVAAVSVVRHHQRENAQTV